MTRRLLWTAGLALGALAFGCGRSVEAEERPRIFAASSLTEVFEELALEFERAHGQAVDLHFAGTPTLVFQLREGAPADVFASADAPNMERVVQTERVVSRPRRFATNRLALITPPGNPADIQGLEDLARTGLRVGLCGPDVPAGRYAREALARAGVRLAPSSEEPSVKAVVAKVSLGELDAGIVFLTDGKGARAELECLALPDAHAVRAEYSVAELDGPRGSAFIEFLQSPAGRSVLERHGFGVP